jgi:hypothetical protein
VGPLTLVGLAMIAACGRVGFDHDQAITIELEAEAGTVVPPFEALPDVGASGGAFVLDGNPNGESGPGSATYTFSVPAGTYYLWGRVRADSSAVDSFFVQVDGGEQIYYQSTDCAYTTAWTWAPVTAEFDCPNSAAVLPLPLTDGAHSVRFTSREGESAFDRLIIIDDPAFVPAD